MRKLLLLAALSLAATMANAGVVGAHIGTYHFNRDAGFNELNPGIYYKHTSGATVGAYYNSEEKVSAYIGYTLEWTYAGFTVGGLSGYGKPTPFIIPFLNIDKDLRLAYLPQNPASRVNTQGIHLMKDF